MLPFAAFSIKQSSISKTSRNTETQRRRYLNNLLNNLLRYLLRTTFPSARLSRIVTLWALGFRLSLMKPEALESNAADNLLSKMREQVVTCVGNLASTNIAIAEESLRCQIAVCKIAGFAADITTDHQKITDKIAENILWERNNHRLVSAFSRSRRFQDAKLGKIHANPSQSVENGLNNRIMVDLCAFSQGLSSDLHDLSTCSIQCNPRSKSPNLILINIATHITVKEIHPDYREKASAEIRREFFWTDSLVNLAGIFLVDFFGFFSLKEKGGKNPPKNPQAKFKSEFGSFADKKHTARIWPWQIILLLSLS